MVCIISVFQDSTLIIVFIFIPGEPPTYCPRRPRSTSEAISLACGDDPQKTRSKDDHKALPLNETPKGADHVHAPTCILLPHPEDDLDLCPPAAGISSLDFDPMSFQCSLPSATPRQQHHKDGNKWRRTPGCSSESEPISSPNNNISCSQSPDISPVLCKGGKVSFKLLSPKFGDTFLKSQADIQSASSSPPPLPSSPSPVEKCEAPLEDGKVVRASHQRCSPLSTASQASALTDLSQSAQNLPDPGKYCSSSVTYSHILDIVSIYLSNNAFCSFL